MTNFKFDQLEAAPLSEKELIDTKGGGKTPWESLIENAGELLDTAAGVIDGLLGRHR